MATTEFHVSKVLQDLRQQKIDVRTVVNEVCNRIEEKDLQVQALLPEANRRERLLKEAEQLEKRFPDSNKRPPLFGVPIGVKDIIRVNGFGTKAGSSLPEHLFEGPEAACVSRLKEAGALIVGKTTTTEFAYREPATTSNPHNKNHTPGGSSSGSAAGVAAGFYAVALGTQTIGSVIRPAAFCGVVGFKPSLNRIETEGLIHFSPTVDHIGLFSQDIEGMKITASVLCNEWDSEKEFKVGESLVLAIPEGPYLEKMSASGLGQFETYVKKLEKQGHIIKRVSVFEDIERISQLHSQLILFELAKEHANWFDEHESLYRPLTRESILEGQQISVKTAREAKEATKELRQRLNIIMDGHNIDLWVCPPALGTAPKGLSSTGDPIMNLPWTNAGMPAISLPVEVGENNLPLGLQFVARYGHDEQLLSWVNDIAKTFNR